MSHVGSQGSSFRRVRKSGKATDGGMKLATPGTHLVVGFPGGSMLKERVLLWPVEKGPPQVWVTLGPEDAQRIESFSQYSLRRDLNVQGYPSSNRLPIEQFQDMIGEEELAQLIVEGREDARKERERRGQPPSLS